MSTRCSPLVRIAPIAYLLILSTCALGQGAPPSTFTNWETPPVHPIEITPDGTKLLVCNTADNRLEVFTLGSALPVKLGTIPVGLDPVSVRARTNTEVWVVNNISDTVSIVSLTTLNVIATLSVGNAPQDIVFAGSPSRAYVSISQENALRVYDPANRAAAPTTINLAGSSPRALATDGTRVFVAFFEAGNRTIAVPTSIVSNPAGPWAGQNPPPNTTSGFSPPMAAGLPTAPAVSIILNKEGIPGNYKDAANVIWDSMIPWGIHEHGIALYNTSTQALTYANNICNINMGLSVQPGTNRVTVVGEHLTDYVRFETNMRSGFGRWLWATFDPTLAIPAATIRELNPHLFANGVSPPYFSTATAAQRALGVADTRAAAWNSAGTSIYIAGMGSANIAKVLASNGSRQATIVVGQGPCGLAMDTARSRLYAFNRFDATVSSINISTDTVVGAVGFYDPTPTVIKIGRPVHYDTHATSQLGIVSCNSCHIDTKTDAQAWDLGNPAGAMKAFDQTCDVGTPFAGTCGDWHPVKGALMTQPLADTVGNGPLHWRGDRPDIHSFSVGFTGLLGADSPPSDSQLTALTNFLATLKRSPQPFRTVTDGLPGSVPGFSGNPTNGQALFNGPPIGGTAASCVQCHSLPTGGGTTIISANVLGQSQGLKPPPLRDLYTKTGRDSTITTSRRGFGFGHDGTTDTVFDFLSGHFANFAAGAAGIQQRRDLEAFLMCFSSGTHPAIGKQITIDGTNNNAAATTATINTFTSLADTGVVGLIAKGISGGIARGYAYLPGTGTMQSDRVSQIVTVASLVSAAAAGSEMTFTVVAAGNETRIALDRDSDGYFDRDELDHGSLPDDPNSVPPSNCRPAISFQPQDTASCPAGSATFTVTAFGNPTYQWRHNAAPLANGNGITGATTSTLMIDNLSATDAGAYDCVLTNGCGSTTSAAANLSVCIGDFNCDGGIDGSDVAAFFTEWEAGNATADVNADGGIDGGDVQTFFIRWEAGC